MRKWLPGILLAIGVAAIAPAVAQNPQEPPAAQAPSRREGMLKVGDAAPDFTLRDLEGKNPVQLSSFKQKKPVVLVFGSIT